MKKKCYGDIQRQITALIPIVKLCITLTAEVEKTKKKLTILPQELENLTKQANYLLSKTSQKNGLNSFAELQEMEFRLDSFVDDLETVFSNLTVLDGNLKNVVSLKEKLEAIQEERIDGITPERIYKLLEKQQRSRHRNQVSSSEKPKSNNFLVNINNNIWQKIFKLGHRLRDPKVVFSLAIIASLSIGWTAGYHSSLGVSVSENETVEATKN